MRKSTNFNLNLVEGSDLVNPLVQDVPNYEAIDEQMFKNESNSVGIATELKNGTVHALTRTIPNASMFRFQATSNFTAGDTFTVDGIQVSALTPSGETLASGCYIIGSEVLCVLRETLLTVYVSGGTVTTAQDSERLGGHLPEYYGTAENVSTALRTAQSANQLTLNLQQNVENLSANKKDKYGEWQLFSISNTFSNNAQIPALESIHQLLIYPWREATSNTYNFINPFIIDIDDYNNLIKIASSSHPDFIAYDWTANNDDKIAIYLYKNASVTVNKVSGTTTDRYAIYYR